MCGNIEGAASLGCSDLYGYWMTMGSIRESKVSTCVYLFVTKPGALIWISVSIQKRAGINIVANDHREYTWHGNGCLTMYTWLNIYMYSYMCVCMCNVCRCISYFGTYHIPYMWKVFYLDFNWDALSYRCMYVYLFTQKQGLMEYYRGRHGKYTGTLHKKVCDIVGSHILDMAMDRDLYMRTSEFALRVPRFRPITINTYLVIWYVM